VHLPSLFSLLRWLLDQGFQASHPCCSWPVELLLQWVPVCSGGLVGANRDPGAPTMLAIMNADSLSAPGSDGSEVAAADAQSDWPRCHPSWIRSC
jgi:hypothetical protein